MPGVAWPGGRVSLPDVSPLAAGRETFEEIGVPQAAVGDRRITG